MNELVHNVSKPENVKVRCASGFFEIHFKMELSRKTLILTLSFDFLIIIFTIILKCFLTSEREKKKYPRKMRSIAWFQLTQI